MNRRAATVAQLQVAGDKIRVEMSQKHVPDLETECFGVLQVLLDIALRIDDDARGASLVA